MDHRDEDEPFQALTGDPDDDPSEALYERFWFEQLEQRARDGNLVAGSEILRSVTKYLEALFCQLPRSVDDAPMRDWLLQFLAAIQANPKRSFVQLLAPHRAGSRPFPKTIEQLHELHLAQFEAIHLVDELVDKLGTKAVFDHVANELNANGRRNAKGDPLTGATIRSWYYAARKRRAADTEL